MLPNEPPARPKLKPCGPVVRAEEFNHWREAARAVDAAHQYLKSMQALAQDAYEQEKQLGYLERPGGRATRDEPGRRGDALSQ